MTISKRLAAWRCNSPDSGRTAQRAPPAIPALACFRAGKRRSDNYTLGDLR